MSIIGRSKMVSDMNSRAFGGSCCQAFFNLTGLFLAVRALKGLVGTAVEAFRMLCINDFPFDQNNDGGKKQTPAKEVLNEKHRGKHHEMSPVIDPAVDTAFILHEL